MNNKYKNKRNYLENDFYQFRIFTKDGEYKYRNNNRKVNWQNRKGQNPPSNQFQEHDNQFQENDSIERISTATQDVIYEDRKRESKIKREIPEIKQKKEREKVNNLFQEYERINTIFDESILLIDNIKDIQIEHTIYFGAFFTNFVKYIYLHKFIVQIKCNQCKVKFIVESNLLRSTKAPGIKIEHCNKQIEILFTQQFQQQKIQLGQQSIVGGLINKIDNIEIQFIEALFYVVCQCDNNQIRFLKMERDKDREQLEIDSKSKFLYQDESYRQLCKYCSREPQIQGGQLIIQIV